LIGDNAIHHCHDAQIGREKIGLICAVKLLGHGIEFVGKTGRPNLTKEWQKFLIDLLRRVLRVLGPKIHFPRLDQLGCHP
jgi:hypothetical protein